MAITAAEPPSGRPAHPAAHPAAAPVAAPAANRPAAGAVSSAAPAIVPATGPAVAPAPPPAPVAASLRAAPSPFAPPPPAPSPSVPSRTVSGAAPLHISVVIAHLNQPGHLARCLAALAAQHRPPDAVIVVDNGSRALPQALCARHGARLLSEPQPGPGPARNRGAAAAAAGVAAGAEPVLAFIDADCIADPGWLAAAEAALADPGAGILGGDVRIALRDPSRPTITEAYESQYAYRMDRYIARQGFTGTGNLVVRRAIFQAVGPFAGIAQAEDRDWGQRATAKGYRIRFVPGMRVYHPARASLAELCVKLDRASAHDYARARTRRFGRLRFALKALAMPPSVLAELPVLATSRRLAGPRARLQALAALTRLRLHRARVMTRLLLRGDAQAVAGSWNRD